MQNTWPLVSSFGGAGDHLPTELQSLLRTSCVNEASRGESPMMPAISAPSHQMARGTHSARARVSGLAQPWPKARRKCVTVSPFTECPARFLALRKLIYRGARETPHCTAVLFPSFRSWRHDSSVSPRRKSFRAKSPLACLFSLELEVGSLASILKSAILMKCNRWEKISQGLFIRATAFLV